MNREGLIYAWTWLIQPFNDRNWPESVAQLATAEFSESGDAVTVLHIRNYNYRSETEFDVAYYDRTILLEELIGAGLIVSHWGSDVLAHTFLSFRFEK